MDNTIYRMIDGKLTAIKTPRNPESNNFVIATKQLVEMRDGHVERFTVSNIVRVPMWDAIIQQGTIECPREWRRRMTVIQLGDRWYAARPGMEIA